MSSSLPLDVGIVIALSEEFNELYDQIAAKCETTRDEDTGHYYYLFDHHCLNRDTFYRCVTTFAGNMGPTKAGLITQRLVTNFKPSTLVMLGIAAGITDDVKLGDVVIATQVDAYMENSKAEGQDDFTLSLGGESYRPSGDLIKFAGNFKFAHREEFRQWQGRCSAELLGLFDSQENIDALIRQGLIRDKAQLIPGHIASGPTVGAAEAFIKWLKRKNRKYLALEMEAAGLMAAVDEETTPRRTLVLRAVSDYGDQRKAELDRINSGAFRLYAIRNAIGLLWAFLDTHALPNPSPLLPASINNHTSSGPGLSVPSPLLEQPVDSRNAEVPIEQIKALSSVIEGEGIIPNVAAGSMKEGSDDVKPATELSTRFLKLPLYKRVRLAQKLGLLFEEEKMLQGFEQARLIFNRAKEERKLEQLWDEVVEAGGETNETDRTKNPFSAE